MKISVLLYGRKGSACLQREIPIIIIIIIINIDQYLHKHMAYSNSEFPCPIEEASFSITRELQKMGQWAVILN